MVNLVQQGHPQSYYLKSVISFLAPTVAHLRLIDQSQIFVLLSKPSFSLRTLSLVRRKVGATVQDYNDQKHSQ